MGQMYWIMCELCVVTMGVMGVFNWREMVSDLEKFPSFWIFCMVGSGALSPILGMEVSHLIPWSGLGRPIDLIDVIGCSVHCSGTID